MDRWDRLPRITEDDFVAHLDDDNFFEEYGNPVVIQSKEHGELVCMSYAYHERMHKEIEAAREAVSKASMPIDQTRPTDHEREIDYWIYEFQMPDEEKKRLLDMAASLGMTSDEFIQTSFRYAMDHPDDSEKEAKLQQIQQANALGICLVRMYPVYQGETEAQAYRRAKEEERQRKQSDV